MAASIKAQISPKATTREEEQRQTQQMKQKEKKTLPCVEHTDRTLKCLMHINIQ